MNPTIIIVNIANGDPDLLNIKTVRILQECGHLILRTAAHPLVQWLDQNSISYSSLDDLYDTAEDFDQLLSLISERLWKLARKKEIVYAVSDSITDASVKALFHSKPSGGKICVIPGTGISDVFCSASLPLLSGSDLRIVSATDFLSGEYNPSSSVLITELDNPILAGQVKLFLADKLGDEHEVFLLLKDKGPVSIPLYQLDRQTGIDHRSAILIPGSGFLERNRFSFSDLEALMKKLRSPDGCPWDRIQTHESLRPYIIEEAWECIACIDQQDPDHLCEELGDLLFQVVFHSSIGSSFGEFSLNDVISSICSKMIHRHPHVFGSCDLKDPETVRAVWEKLKQEETGNRSVSSSLDDVSSGLPSLKYASKTIKKLNGTAAVRSDPKQVLADIENLASSLRSGSVPGDSDILGRLLFLCSELCFILGTDSEMILHQTVDHLKNRLQRVDKEAKDKGKSLEHLTFEELGVYLNHVEDEIE